MEEQEGPTVILHYNGNFAPNPLLYWSGKSANLSEIDVNSMTFNEFVSYAAEHIDMQCEHLYYCVPNVRLAEGIQALQNDCDFSEFLEVAKEHNRVNVYVDHENEPLFDWIELEEHEEPPESEDDEDSILGDDYVCEHEDDEEVKVKRRKRNEEAGVYPRHDESQPWNQMEPHLGMQFQSPVELKALLTNYAVAHGYDLFYETNDKERLLCKCCKGKTPECTFRLWASWKKDERTFQIKSLAKEHTCSRAFKLGLVTYKWLGKMLVEDLMETPKLSVRKIKALVSKKFNLNVSRGQCRNAKKFAFSEIEGNLNDHYAQLWDYAAEIQRSNPGSHVEVHVEPHNDTEVLFDRFYISFKGVVDGWLDGCRKIVGIDGCFLKGMCKGELLSAVGRDANNHIYPIAWAVVSVENKTTWKWFLNNLMEDIDEGGMEMESQYCQMVTRYVIAKLQNVLFLFCYD